MSEETDVKIGYKVKTPCNDCPFRKSAPLHNGVMKDLPEYHKRLKAGSFGHSCHKTDARTDGFVNEYNGEIQHCMGVLSMFKKMDEATDPDALVDENSADYYPMQHGLIHAMFKGGVKYDDIPVDNDVFNGFNEMMEAYRPAIEELARQKESMKGMRISIRNTDGTRTNHAF